MGAGRLRRGFAMALAGVLLSGAASAQTKINLMYTAVSAYGAAFVAKDQGFFAKRGLDVDLTMTTNGSLIMAAIMSGSIQIGTPTPTVFLQAIDGGVDGVALAATNVVPDASQSGILAREGAGISSPADFAGKKVGVPGMGGMLHVVFSKWLQDNKVDPKRVTFVEIGFPQMSDVLRSGNVDAVVAADPFHSRILAQKTGVFVADYIRNLPPQTIASVFAASRQWAQSNPQAVKSFQEAVQEAVDFIPKNPEAAKESFARHTKLPPAIVAALPIPGIAVKMSPAQIDFWSDVMMAQGLISKKPDAAKLVWPWQGAN